jgi:hypothetical protein
MCKCLLASAALLYFSESLLGNCVFSCLFGRTSAAAIHGKALDADVSPADAAAEARGAGGVTLGRLVAGTEWRRPLAANWSGIAGGPMTALLLALLDPICTAKNSTVLH